MTKLKKEKVEETMAFRVTPSEKQRYIDFCQTYRFTFSQMIRKAIEYYMKKVEAMDKDDIMFL